MQLIITNGDELSVRFEKTQPDEQINFPEILSILFSVLDAFTREHLGHYEESVEDSESKEEDIAGYKDYIYEKLVVLMDAFLDNIFPESKEGAFDLTDAAVVYAQDKIIEEAHEEGLTYHEALEKFEAKAKEYVNAKKMS